MSLTPSFTGSSVLDAALQRFHEESRSVIALLTEGISTLAPNLPAEDKRELATLASELRFLTSFTPKAWGEMDEAWRLREGLSELDLRIMQSIGAPSRKRPANSRRRVARHGRSRLVQDHGAAARRSGIEKSHERWAATHTQRFWAEVRAELPRHRNRRSR